MSTSLPIFSSQAPTPPQAYARVVVVVGDPDSACTVTRLDLFPADYMPAEPADYMVCELVEQDGNGGVAVPLASFNTCLGAVAGTGDWEQGKIAFTWIAPPAYQLKAGRSIVARWDPVGSGQPMPGCAWRIT